MPIARSSMLRSGFVIASLSLAMTGLGCDEKSATTAPTPDTPVATTTTEPKAPDPVATATAEPKASAPEASAAAAPPKDSAAPKAGGKTAPTATKVDTEPKKGSDVSAASFATWLQSAGSYSAGKQGNVTAVLVAKSPYKCNAKYPYKFKVDAPSGGVSYPQDTVRGMQISPKRSTMAIPFVPAQAGKATISGTLSFSICTDERCVIEKRKLSVTVDVK